MLIDLTGMKIVNKSEHHTCEFHKKNPGVQWAGCTCSAGISQTIVPDDTPPKKKCAHCDGTGQVPA